MFQGGVNQLMAMTTQLSYFSKHHLETTWTTMQQKNNHNNSSNNSNNSKNNNEMKAAAAGQIKDDKATKYEIWKLVRLVPYEQQRRRRRDAMRTMCVFLCGTDHE